MTQCLRDPGSCVQGLRREDGIGRTGSWGSFENYQSGLGKKLLQFWKVTSDDYHTPPAPPPPTHTHTTKLFGGYIGFTLSVRPSVRPSVCPASRVPSLAPTVLVGPFSYFYILSSNFRRCVLCKVTCKIWNFGNFFKICNFDFVFFWLGIWCESLVWLILGRWGVVSQNAGILVVLVIPDYVLLQ